LLTWLSNLGEDDPHPQAASRCFDWRGANLEREERGRTVGRLKAVLDARGIYVALDEIPDDVELESGRLYQPFPNSFPDLRIERVGEEWLVTRDTVRAIPRLHADTFALDVDSWINAGPHFLRQHVLGLMWWQVLSFVALLLIAYLMRAVVVRFLTGQGSRLLASQRMYIEPDLIRRAASPVGTLMIVLFLSWALPLLRFGVGTNQMLFFGLRVAAAVAGVVVIYRLVDAACDVWAKRAALTETKLDDQAVPLVRKSAKVMTIILGVIFVLQNMEVDVGSLLAGASLGGLAFSLAARDTVANLFGSLSIFADRPFQVGDWIKVEGVEGVVEEVGMRSTRVRTFYRSLVSVPNAKVADAVIDNYGRRDARRDTFRLGILYSTTSEQMEAFCDGIRAILHNNEKVQKNGFEVHFAAFAESGLEVLVYYFLEVSSWSDELRQRHLVYLEILRLAESLGVDFAFPTRTLHVASAPRLGEAFEPRRVEVDALSSAVRDYASGGSKARPLGPKISSGYYPGVSAARGPEPSPDESTGAR